MTFLQFEDLLSYFEVFSVDPLLFQFSGTQVQALRAVLLMKLGGGVTLGEQGLQTVRLTIMGGLHFYLLGSRPASSAASGSHDQSPLASLKVK